MVCDSNGCSRKPIKIGRCVKHTYSIELSLSPHIHGQISHALICRRLAALRANTCTESFNIANICTAISPSLVRIRIAFALRIAFMCAHFAVNMPHTCCDSTHCTRVHQYNAHLHEMQTICPPPLRRPISSLLASKRCSRFSLSFGLMA